MISTVTFILGYLLAVAVYIVIEVPFVATYKVDTVHETQLSKEPRSEPAEEADEDDESHLKAD